MKTLFLLLSILCFSYSKASIINQMHWDEDTIVSKKKDTGVAVSETPIVEADPIVFSDLDQQAKFKYGNDSFSNFLSDNLHYPEVAMENGISGRTIVMFIVEKDGSFSSIKIDKSSGNKDLDEEAIRLVKLLSGKFKPAMQNGQPVRTYARVPIVFELDEE